MLGLSAAGMLPGAGGNAARESRRPCSHSLHPGVPPSPKQLPGTGTSGPVDEGEIQQAEQDAGRHNSLFAYRRSRAILQIRYLLSQSINSAFAKQLLAEPSDTALPSSSLAHGSNRIVVASEDIPVREGEGGRRDRTPHQMPWARSFAPCSWCEAGRGLQEGPQREEHQPLCILCFLSPCTGFKLTKSFLVTLSPIQHSINQRLTCK